MSLDEWDSLCDGCAKCCLHKLEDEDSGEVSYTNVACSQLDIISCRCKNYFERTILVADCVELTKENLSGLKWLPQSCAYRLLNEGKDLYWWHPLVSGDPNSVHEAGVSVKDRVVEEKDAFDLEDFIVTWPDEE
ncbi:MAG: YcgN family cysteine cluster protein [Rhodospirillaceae bacterium]|nr:YcgN family cysteine cluster protein [Rhodospirillaceae bacterium]MBT4588370.1 YcgN family cysteine cluster protein [Rhodospirillaceae bacterium]MBT4940215.1 YcgN family cysteine cluster protein [Rhodospirillaceae bacterium]MBT5938907.1 YcgN family cysteine cluster protein [Rhodospirillaceae bacterium]MBT7266075.1 YcgN family cysteine cluster protein [Rhodospirillaceae bacterium]